MLSESGQKNHISYHFTDWLLFIPKPRLLNYYCFVTTDRVLDYASEKKQQIVPVKFFSTKELFLVPESIYLQCFKTKLTMILNKIKTKDQLRRHLSIIPRNELYTL